MCAHAIRIKRHTTRQPELDQAEIVLDKSAYQFGLLKQEHFFWPNLVDKTESVNTRCINRHVAIKVPNNMDFPLKETVTESDW